MAKREIRGNRIIYPPVGRCIYCAPELPLKERDRLTMEHIFPYALGGTAELPEASCKRHADVTSAVELKVARDMMLAARTKYKAPTRRPKERPTHLPLVVRNGGVEEVRTLAVEQHPATFVLPLPAEPPRLLTGLAGQHLLPSALTFNVFHFGALDDITPSDVEATLVGKVEVTAFFRMVAKIAHAAAVAEKGDGSFRPLLLPLILGEDKVWVDLIGKSDREPQVEEGNISVQTQQVRVGDKVYLASDVRLFPSWSGPEYRVVVGELLYFA